MGILRLFSLLLCLSAHADFVDFTTNPNSRNWDDPRFLLPNEADPQSAQDIFRQLDEGIYLSVGTERSFIGAALSNSTHLLAVDRNPAVVNYNRFTILLFQAVAKEEISLPEKMALFHQLKISPEAIKEKLPSLQLKPSEKSFIQEFTSHREWRSVASDMRNHNFYRNEPRQFQGAKYWQNSEQFEKLMRMASEGKMQAELLDFNDQEAVFALMDSIRKSKIPLSAVDISNAWWKNFMVDLDGTLNALMHGFHERTLLITTWHHMGKARRTYYASTRQAIEEYGRIPGSSEQAMDNLTSEYVPASYTKDGVIGFENRNKVARNTVVYAKTYPKPSCPSQYAKLFE